jgi:phosphate transport system substrate-binding protein
VRKLLILFVLCYSLSGFCVDFKGAGSDFADSVIEKWATNFKNSSNSQLKYDAVGSGAGVERLFKDGTDFAISDEPIGPEELEKNGVIQFPYAIGAIAPFVNFQNRNIRRLNLTGDILADIYLGRITNWNDPAIRKINPGVQLPDVPITPIYRKDPVGASFIFSYYLSHVSTEWKEKVGYGKKVSWPVGKGVEGTKDILTAVAQTTGAIGYFEYNRARGLDLTSPYLMNKDGNFVPVNTKTILYAGKMGNWGSATRNYVILINQGGVDSWPLTMASYAILKTSPKDEAKIERERTALDFFYYALQKGAPIAESAGYIRVPEEFMRKIFFEWRLIRGPNNKPIWSVPKP